MREASTIMVRVRRTITECGYVAVSLSGAIADELSRKMSSSLIAEAIRLAGAHAEWAPEGEPIIEVHPVQKPQLGGDIP